MILRSPWVTQMFFGTTPRPVGWGGNILFFGTTPRPADAGHPPVRGEKLNIYVTLRI